MGHGEDTPGGDKGPKKDFIPAKGFTTAGARSHRWGATWGRAPGRGGPAPRSAIVPSEAPPAGPPRRPPPRLHAPIGAGARV
jgi:hypothetical protein